MKRFRTKGKAPGEVALLLLALVGANQVEAANASVSTLASASISADTSGATFTALTGPVLDEGTNRDVNTLGTIILAPPSGFTFDPTATIKATVSRLDTGTAALLTLSPAVTVTANAITNTVTAIDAATARSRITWSGIRVRPTAGTPLASGNITMLSSSTAAITGITKGTTSFGTLTEAAGAATTIRFVQGPPASVTAGATLSPAVTVKTTDQFGNPVSGLSVTMSLNGGGTLTGGSAQSTASGRGTATFGGLSISQTGSKTLTASVSSPVLSVTSGSFSVTPGAIGHYVVSATATQTRGTPFSVTVTAQDANTNTVTTDSSTVVTLTSSTRNALFDGTGDSSFSNNTGTLASGTFTINAKDNFGESVTITATDVNAKTGTSSAITVNGLAGDFRSAASSGNWDAVGSWQTWNGSSWLSATSVPTGAVGVNIAILNGNTVTLRGATNLQGILLVSGTLSFSGTGVLTVGSGGILQCAGTVNGSTSTLIFSLGGTYQHNRNGGTIPTAAWNSATTCQIIGVTSSVPGGLGQSFGNLTWNCPSQSGNINLGGSPTTIAGNLSVASTGTGQLQLNSSTGSATTTVSGNYIHSGGKFVIKAGSTGTETLTVKSFSLAGGTFDMTSSGTSILNVGGDFSITGAGLFTRSGNSTASVNFNGSNPQSFTKSGSMQGTINYTVNSGSTLLMGTNRLTGAGNFTLSSGARLGSGDPNGITSGTTASGNIQVTGTRTFNAGASYIFNGTTAQVTGNGLPATITGNVTNANSAGLSLTANETINTPGNFVVNSGAVMTMGTAAISGTGAFVLGSGGTLAIGSTAGITSSGATGNIQTSTRSFSTGANYIFNGAAAQVTGNGLPTPINSLSINNTAGTVTLSQVTAVTTAVTLANGAKLSLPGGTSSSSTLSITGVNEVSGTWGNTGSGAVNIDSTHFAGAGVLNVGSLPASNTALATSGSPSTYGSSVTFTATVTGSGPTPTGTVTFKEGSTTLGIGTLSGSGVTTFTTSNFSVAGSPHSITAVYGGDANFNSSTSGVVVQAVGQRSITVTADAKSKSYGDSDPALTYQLTSGSLVNGDILSGALTRVPGEQAGAYAIRQGSIDAGTNYALSYVGANLTISPRLLLARADDQSRTYGQTNPPFTITYTGFTGSDSAVNLMMPPQASTTVDTNSPVGLYAITLMGGSDTNYSLVLSNGTLHVTAAALTVTADSQSKTYGQSDPALTCQITSGALLNTDILSGSLTRTAGESVGAYAIQQGNLTAGTNYALMFVPANLTISASPITVMADAKSKVYGNTDPALTYQITSGTLVSGDSLSGNLNRAPGESVSSYGIQQGSLTAGANYNLTFVPAILTITTRPITVTADGKSKIDGSPDPALTCQVTGGSLVPGDSLSGSLTRMPGESVGVYPILQGTLTAGGNYALTFVPANLTTLAPVSPEPKIDLNGNGMSDIWEMIYGAQGLDPNGSASGDGISNLAKSIAGVNPSVANDFPAITKITLVGTNVTLTMPSVLGKQYQLQSLEALDSDVQTNWIIEATVIARTGSVVTLTAPKTIPAKFLRIAITDVNTAGDGLNDWEKYQLGLDPFSAYSNGQLDTNGLPLNDYAYVATYVLGGLTNLIAISATGPAAWQPAPGQPATQTGTFTLTRAGNSTIPITVTLSVGGLGLGMASEGLDYSVLPRAVTIPAGANSQTITLTPLADTNLLTSVLAEVSLLPGAGYQIGAASKACVVIYPAVALNGTGLTGQYFTGSSSNYADSINFNPANAALTRLDPTIDFIWTAPADSTTNGGSGDTVRWSGQVQPQYSETYTFVAHSDDGVKLWVNDQLIIDNWTVQGPTDSAGAINLVAGFLYDIRLEYFNGGSGEAHLEWFSPSQTRQIIPANYLYPTLGALAPTTIISPLSAVAFPWQPFSYTVTGVNSPALGVASPLPPGLSFNPATGLISGTPTTAGDYQIVLTASNAVGSSVSVLNLTVSSPGGSGTAGVWREVWTGVPGSNVPDIPVNTQPSFTTLLGTLEGVTGSGQNYGERLRGYLTVPASGNYYFWIAASDSAELWISNDSDPVNKLRRAYVLPSANPAPPPAYGTASRQWNLQPNQKSPWLALAAGQRYYLEILHKAGMGAQDNFAVGWLQDPTGTNSAPGEVIPGSVLTPYSASPPALFPKTLYTANLLAQGYAVSGGVGSATLQLSANESEAVLKFNYRDLSSAITGEHIHSDPYLDHPSQILFDIDQATPQPDGSYVWPIAPSGSLSVKDILEIIGEGKAYINIHTVNFPAGEINGHFVLANGNQAFTPPQPPPAWADDHASTNAAARFLVQATFGPSPAEIANVQAMGYEGWINDQFLRPAAHHLPLVLANVSTNPTVPYPSSLTFNAWWQQSITAPDQLRQRMAFALSELMVVSEKNTMLQDNATALSAYYDTLLDNAFGNFRTLLEAVTLSPAMGLYLNMCGSDAGNPSQGTHADQNYGREVMQLFSIGLNRLWPDGSLVLDSNGDPVPTYGQSVVEGFASVFTGWNYSQPSGADGRLPLNWQPQADCTDPMVLVPTHHELGAKLLLDNVALPAAQGSEADPNSTNFDNYGAQDLESALDSIFNHQNVGPFVCRQLIQRLVTSSPSPEYVYRVAQVFDDNGTGVRGDLQAVIKAILLDYEARSSDLVTQSAFGKQREPLLRATALARAFPAPGLSTWQMGYTEDDLYQTPLRAPTVFNFFDPHYQFPGELASAGLTTPEFQLTTDATVPSQMKFFQDALVGAASSNSLTGFRQDGSVMMDVGPWVTADYTGSTNGLSALVDGLSTLLLGGQLSAAAKAVIVNYTSDPANFPYDTPPTPAQMSAIVLDAVYLIAISPDFIIQK